MQAPTIADPMTIAVDDFIIDYRTTCKGKKPPTGCPHGRLLRFGFSECEDAGIIPATSGRLSGTRKCETTPYRCQSFCASYFSGWGSACWCCETTGGTYQKIPLARSKCTILDQINSEQTANLVICSDAPRYRVRAWEGWISLQQNRRRHKFVRRLRYSNPRLAETLVVEFIRRDRGRLRK